ncbi:fluoride efflux transporter FluC [Nicoliella lavandulae]|uniref:Fluoride-specific ion channel FluC n=1 Tax=Nicoliella lavandulae TaxID=3082954 RepID=A0ABU8SJD6_9LACO
MLTKIIIVGLAASLGAVFRYALIELIGNKWGWKDFPLATVVINVSGAFILGLLAGHLPTASLSYLIGSGVMGGYTTFSTYMNETVRLQFRSYSLSMLYFFGTSILGIAAALVGMAL